MTARELHEALQGVPAEALCESIEYDSENDIWRDEEDGVWIWHDHAAALQRDAMTEWLDSRDAVEGWYPEVRRLTDQGKSLWPFTMTDGYGSHNQIDGFHPTRLHALAAACKFVTEHGKT